MKISKLYLITILIASKIDTFSVLLSSPFLEDIFVENHALSNSSITLLPAITGKNVIRHAENWSYNNTNQSIEYNDNDGTFTAPSLLYVMSNETPLAGLRINCLNAIDSSINGLLCEINLYDSISREREYTLTGIRMDQLINHTFDFFDELTYRES